jgi:bifunctional oligoribonuclease and PAP phosphatase NrnA
MNNIAELKDFLASPKKIVITTHQKPDADALGSSLAMSGYLKKLGHTVKVITPTDYPSFLFWMPDNDSVLVYDKNKTHTETQNYFLSADLIIALDFSQLPRIAPLDEFVQQSKAKRLLLDHHIGNTHFADYELWRVEAAATCELVYDFIILMGHKHLINKDIAECIYAGIVTDTGSFKFESTSSKVHRNVAELIEIGVEVNKVQRLIYDNNTEQRLRFLGYALSQKLTLLPSYKTAYFALSIQEQQKFNTQTGDTEGLVNYALSIAGIRMAVILIEKNDGTVKMSFRSYGTLAVNEIAEKHFNGGGHKNAAGGKSELSLAATETKLLALLDTYKQMLNNE